MILRREPELRPGPLFGDMISNGVRVSTIFHGTENDNPFEIFAWLRSEILWETCTETIEVARRHHTLAVRWFSRYSIEETMEDDDGHPA